MPVRQDGSEPSVLSSSLAGYVFLFLAAAAAVVSHFRDWIGVLGRAAGGVALLVVGSGRIYRPAVTRAPDSITCRYTPWREGSLYVLMIAGPGMAAAALTGATGWVRYLSGVLAVLVVVGVGMYLREWRRCRLRIAPASLTVTVPAHGYRPTEIARQQIVSITGGTGARRNGDTGPVTQIAYLTNDSAPGAPSTMLIGPTNAKNAMWVTVEQSDLLAALQAWKDGDPRDPTLLDRVEALLRGATLTASAPDPAAQPGVAWASGDDPLASSAPAPTATGEPSATTGHPSAPIDHPASGYPPAPADRPSQWRWLRFVAIGAACLAGAAAYPAYQSTHRGPDAGPNAGSAPQASNSTPPPVSSNCEVPRAPMTAVPKKNPDEPTIYLPLSPGWHLIPATGAPNLRALYANDSIRADDFTPVIQVDVFPTAMTYSLADVAASTFGDARKLMTVTNEATDTVCGHPVSRADTSGYDPDGRGDQSGTTVLTVVDKDGTRWVAAATIKARNTRTPEYGAQRQALIEGFHAASP